MNLAAYLNHIGLDAVEGSSLATLIALHRAHLHRIPFENLDVLLGRPVHMDPEGIFDKIVGERRGGWCYEMNGLMGWALGEIGFEVTRLAGGVMREHTGDAQIGTHLCLMVRCGGQPYLVDVGFGGSLAEPLPLCPVERVDQPFRIALSEADNGFWRFSEQAHGETFTFDFRSAPAVELLLAEKAEMQRSHPASPFVQNLIVQQRIGSEHRTLRGRVLTKITGEGEEESLLNSADELVAMLHSAFGLDVPEAATLWPAVCARHSQRFPDVERKIPKK